VITTATNSTAWESVPAVSIQLQPPGPVEWNIADLLQSDDGPACWFGDSGSYKSFLALHVAHCISTGEAVFGKFATKKRNRVTYVNIDAGKNSFERRVCRLPKANANFYVVNADLWNLDEFECLLADNYGSFVVLDCWTDIFEQPTDADMAHFMRQSIKYFRDRFEESGANGIVIDHSKRAQSGSSLRGGDLVYGSAQKKGTWRQMTLVEKVPLAKFVPGHARVKFSCVKMSEAEEFQPFFVDLTFDQGTYRCEYAGPVTSQDEETTKTNTLREAIIEHLRTTSPEPRSAIEIAEAIGTPRNSRAFSDGLTAAVIAGAVASVGKGRNTRYVYAGDALSLEMPQVLTTAGLR